MTLTLAQLDMKQSGIIREVGGSRALRRRLMELGLVPGTRITLVSVSPLGDPLQVEVRNCRLSIRKKDARLLQVRP